MCHLHGCGMRLEMIVDPSREDGRFHGHRPWLGKCFHPQVQRQSCGGYRTCCVDTATAVLHAVADRFLVNIQTDVVHSLHGGASLVVSESAWSLSSAFLHQALLHDLFIQTIELLGSTEALNAMENEFVCPDPTETPEPNSRLKAKPAVSDDVIGVGKLIWVKPMPRDEAKPERSRSPTVQPLGRQRNSQSNLAVECTPASRSRLTAEAG